MLPITVKPLPRSKCLLMKFFYSSYALHIEKPLQKPEEIFETWP